MSKISASHLSPNKSLLRSGGQWSLVCKEVVVMDKVPAISLGEPPGAELSRYALSACLLGVVASGALQGCIPYPHREPMAPQISRVIRNNDNPQPGVTLHYTYPKLSNEPDCSGFSVEAKTGADGHFFFKMPKKFRFFLAIGDPAYSYELCASGDDGPILLWRNFEFATVSSPAELDCDLSAPLLGTRPSKGRCVVKASKREN